jgi:catechol 2,3-dioxygenase-like lactoylglutathione lyase family enzyme
MATQERQGIDRLSTWISGISSHVGICVPDMDEAKRFYSDILGFQVEWEAEGGGEVLDDLTGIKGLWEHCVQITVPGGPRIELQAYLPLEMARRRSTDRDSTISPSP